ncbi:hypothetical protein NHX12_015230 [Muraenolepis orangiensis]|uniref:LIM zinc-binding domain-containing protein n=1 Tax=Muraenolepis orangiensis TaxID=630683 RepID=A0A9Q0DCY9_9TELE|nr:hypothetical protein NHX12_015230 [Muraenolepis orangiensis]
MVASYECKECKDSLYGKKYILQEENPYCLTCYEKHFSNTCHACQEGISCTTKCSLAEKPFATKDDEIMCVDCYSHQFSAKCFACLKTIMPGTKKMEHQGHSWHESCFSCDGCQQPIGSRSFVNKEGGRYCLPCYEERFALQCIQCEKPITTGGVNYRDQPWHKECFACVSCKQQLSGQRFTSRDDVAYCLTCFCDVFAKKCTHCTDPIGGPGGSKYISFEARQWHNHCFNCKKCSASLVGRGFLTARDDVLCTDCGKDA